nr:hypothetical protein [Oceanicoccus sp. KOV_DT_Chl]
MSTIPWLDPTELSFPATEQALDDPNGLLAVGGDLTTQRLIQAYRQGIFPWYQQPEPILWWSRAQERCYFLVKWLFRAALEKRCCVVNSK